MSKIIEEREEIAQIIENFLPTWVWQAGISEECEGMMRPLANLVRRRTCDEIGHMREGIDTNQITGRERCIRCSDDIQFPPAPYRCPDTIDMFQVSK